jgi:hypothetical protein
VSKIENIPETENMIFMIKAVYSYLYFSWPGKKKENEIIHRYSRLDAKNIYRQFI